MSPMFVVAALRTSCRQIGRMVSYKCVLYVSEETTGSGDVLTLPYQEPLRSFSGKVLL